MNSSNGSTLVLFPAYAPTLTIVSCCFSVVGAAAILLTYVCWKESRSTSRTILLCIALSDLISSLGYIFGAALFLETFHNATSVDAKTAESMSPFSGLCQVQSFITTTAMMCSFWWTTILSLHLFLSVAKMRLDLSRKLFPLYLLLATAVPLVVTVPVAATGWLGIGNSTASVSWCFISRKVKDVAPSHSPYDVPIYDILEFVAGKMWELVAFVLIFSFYVALKCDMSRRVSWQAHAPNTLTNNTHPVQKQHTPHVRTHITQIHSQIALQCISLPSPLSPLSSTCPNPLSVPSLPLPLHQRRNPERAPLQQESSWSSFPQVVENKLLLVPFLFILSRLFGMLRYALSLVIVFRNSNPTIDSVIYNHELVGLHVSVHRGRRAHTSDTALSLHDYCVYKQIDIE